MGKQIAQIGETPVEDNTEGKSLYYYFNTEFPSIILEGIIK